VASGAAEQFRPLNDLERAVIVRLLEADETWRDLLRSQLDGASVRPWPECAGHCLSVEFLIDGDRRGSRPVPVEGRFTDADGMPVEILLFECAGKLSDLEFVVFSHCMKRAPDVAEIRVQPTSRRRGGAAQSPPRDS